MLKVYNSVRNSINEQTLSFMRKYLIMLIILATSLGKSFCQVNPVWNVPSPEIASLGTYGQIPVGLYTGIPNINIPIYDIKVGKYTFPISISYHTASVKPHSQGGCLGLGWSLMAGGYVTRTVRGPFYDEKCDVSGKPYGYYAFAKRLGDTSESNLQNEHDSLYFENDIHNKSHEISADEFSFSFFGYSGNFYYNPDGNWTVVSDQDIKVEFDERDGFVYLDQVKQRINCRDWQNADANNRFFSKFTLTTPDGCKYEFGGLDAMEFSIPYYGRPNADITATTWRLSKITTPDHRSVIFSYDTSSLLCNISYEPQMKVLENIRCSSVKTTNFHKAAFTGFLSYPVNIKSIETQNEKINFVYETDWGYGSHFSSNSLYWAKAADVTRYNAYKGTFTINSFGMFLKENDVSNADEIRRQLKNNILHCIQIDKGKGSRTFYFDYELNNRRKLSLFTVREGIPDLIKKYKTDLDTKQQYLHYEIPFADKRTGMPEYHFLYNTSTLLPRLSDLTDTDSWGYYNGRNVVLSETPEFKVSLPNYGATTAEILTDIIYPTGGRTCLEYELHTYSKQVANNISSIEDKVGTAGGLRIAKVTNRHADNSIESIKKYYYTEDKLHPEKSSGISMRKLNVEESYKLGDGYMYLFSKGGISTPVTNQGTPDVGYSCVIEETLDGNGKSLGYTKCHFTNYDTDIWGNKHLDEVPSMLFNHGNIGGSTPYTSHSEERGKLLSKEIFDGNGKIVSKAEYKYQKVKELSMPTMAQRFLNICGDPDGGLFANLGWLTQTHLYSYLPCEQRETCYFHGDSIVTTTTLNYDDHKQTMGKTTQVGGMPKRVTVYKYPYNDNRYDWMKKLHILSPIVATTTSEGNYRETEETTYSSKDGIPYVSCSTMTFNGDDIKENYKVKLTDDYGNPIEIEKEGMQIVLIWGNKGQTLLAKIENATYETAKYQLGCMSDKYIDIDYLIANRHKLPSAHVTIYRYDNALRLISVTSPNGVTEYYAYDGLDRLRKEYYLDNTDGNKTNRTRKKYGYGYNNGE